MPFGLGSVVVRSFTICLLAASPAAADIIHVDDDAANGGDGTSWATAFNNLNDALAVATAGDEVWVAGGTYIPTAPAGRDGTFSVPDGVQLLGGFSGREADISERLEDIFEFRTVLSGDDDRYTVVTLTGAGASTVVDGFDIRNGLADIGGPPQRRRGAGIYAFDSTPLLSRLIVQNNEALDLGGGIYLGGDGDGGFVRLVDVRVRINEAGNGGGGIYTEINTDIADSRIEDNDAVAAGGIAVQGGEFFIADNLQVRGNEATTSSGGGILVGMPTSASTSQISNTDFIDNTAFIGGAAVGYTSAGDHLLRNAIVRDNENTGLSTSAGTINIAFTSPSARATIENVLITGNDSDGNGTALRISAGNATTVNITIVGNDAAGLAGAISANGGSLTLANTIVWDNNAAGAPAGNFVNTLSAGSFATVTILNSILEDWDARPPSITGANTTGSDPLFIDANGNDNIFGTADDNLRLLPGSPAIDAGNNLFLSPFAAFDVYDQFRVLDDIGTPDTGDAAGFGSVVDIGAAEFQGTSAACAADIAPPLGVFDIFDVIEFLALFDAADPAADLAAPAGVFDIFDVLDYLASTDDC